MGVKSYVVKIGFTGTREGLTSSQYAGLTEEWQELRAKSILMGCTVELHHGDCLGADEEAHRLAVRLGFRTVIHPPESPKLRAYCEGDEELKPKEYLKRNKDIVNSVVRMYACPKERREKVRSGTWMTVRYARSKMTPILLLLPGQAG
jgi:hypothetical protein